MRLILLGCTVFLVSCQTQKKITTSSQALPSLDTKKSYEQLEKENLELNLRNSILLKALKEKRLQSAKKSIGTQVQTPFPEFDEVLFEQAQSAYEAKDLERLVEAMRILKTNHTSSQYLPRIYIWLSDLQIQNNQHTQALVTLDEFIRTYSSHEYASRAFYLKAKIYEKLNLNVQAREVYMSVQKLYPKSKERGLAEVALKRKEMKK